MLIITGLLFSLALNMEMPVKVYALLFKVFEFVKNICKQ